MRNIILNAKDPISLFKRDIPKVLVGKSLDDCEREFLNNFKKSFEELKDCVDNLIIDLKKVVYETFCTNSKESLAERFLAIKEYLNNDDLKILFNSIVETNVSEEIWINRIATFVNKQRVPKDWNDNDYADFKIKIKELANKFFAIESVVGLNDSFATKNYYSVLNKYLKLTKAEQVLLLKKIANL